MKLNDNLAVSGNAEDAEYTDERRLIFFSVQIGEALYFLRASAPVCVVCVLLIQPAKFPFISVLLLNKNKCQIPAFTPHLWGTIPYAHDWRMTYPPGRVL